MPPLPSTTPRKPMWDKDGEWLEREPESAKALNRLLCRPVTQMWMESPEARARKGKARWEPLVSEYREVGPERPLSRTAAHLLATQPPQAEPELMRAADMLMSTGRHNMLVDADTAACPDRPATALRRNGQMSLTVLKPNSAAAKDWHQQGEGEGGSYRPPSAQGEGHAPVPLQVCLGPKRSRQVISFEDRILSHDDTSRPSLTLFEHVQGSRVGQSLFPTYQLPNGKQTYMYYNGGILLDEVHVDAVSPPPRPSSVPAALQQTLPLADVLNLISKPPGSAPPFITYKPVPHLVPLPTCHTLAVKKPASLQASAFGDLREDNLQLILVANRITRPETMVRTETIETAVPEAREPWTLPASIFKPRAKEADARAFLDTEGLEARAFERDWARASAKEKFTGMLCRENKANRSNPKDDAVMLQEVHDVLLQHYRLWQAAFQYYAANSSGDPYHLPLNAWTTFLDDCQVADSESQFIKRSDCDTIFIVCNFQPDKKSAEAQVNLENAMMRYEFLEALVRAALSKYGKGQATDDVAEAVRLLLEGNLLPHLPPGAQLAPNDFRTARLYFEEVDLLYKRHAVLLKALYSRYRLKPVGGGLRTKAMKLEGWLQLMHDAHLVDSQLTLQDVTLAFLWSRMLTVDEVKDYSRLCSLTFVDFLEALGRVADMKGLPLESDLAGAGYNNILDWSIDKERAEGNDTIDPSSPSPSSPSGPHTPSGVYADVFHTRPSAGFTAPQHRPLHAKLGLLLDLLLRRLFWDPSQAELPFSYDALLKQVKKADKEMGP